MFTPLLQDRLGKTHMLPIQREEKNGEEGGKIRPPIAGHLTWMLGDYSRSFDEKHGMTFK